jgi:hypothetical protein
MRIGPVIVTALLLSSAPPFRPPGTAAAQASAAHRYVVGVAGMH